MGFKLVALSTLLLTVSSFSVEKNAIGGGCVDLLCPETASHYGLRNLVNEDTLKTDSCTLCSQCTENGYSVCLRPKDSRASRTAGGCSCAHQLAANCHTDLTQTQHPANLSMKAYTACYADALQRPPQPLAVNENSSVVVTIEPFWLEPYWRHLKIENVTLHYKFIVKAPEHCEAEVESTPTGVHTCIASVLVDLSESKEDSPQGKDDEDYEHSDNYDQYDDDLPPEVQFDRDVFTGAKELETYYTATVRRERQIKASAPKDKQIYDGESLIESDHLKFDLKPEVYGMGETEIVDEPPTEDPVPFAVEESATVVQEEKDENDVSEETGGTNFFEEEEKKEEETKKTDDSEENEEDGVLKVNLADIEPTKLKSQEDAKKKAELEGSEEEEKKEEDDVETTTSEKEEEKEDEEKKDEEEAEDAKENEEKSTGSSTVAEEDEEEDKKSSEDDSDEEDSDETTTVELVEGESDSSQNVWERTVNSPDFPRVRNIAIGTLGFFVLFILIVLLIFYRQKYCCCFTTKESKTSNGYRYTSANQPPTELKTVSRNPSGTAPEDQRLLAEGEAMENFRNVVKSGTTFNPNKVELGITVGVGKFGPIYRAMFNSYNGSVHDVNVYMLKNVSRLSDAELLKLTSLLKANISAGAHQNVVSLCGISQAGPDVMLMWEPLHQSVLRGVLRESRCARFGTEPFNMASFLSSERLAAIAIGCCTGVEHLIKKNVFPSHISTSNVLLAERGIVKIGGFGLAEHHALDMTTESAPTNLRWMPPEYFKKNQKMMFTEQTLIWPLGVTLWEIFSLGGTPFASLRQVQTFIDSMRDGSAHLDPITYCGEAVSQLLSACTSHNPEARGDIRTIIKRLECISADAKTQINLSYREDFPYLPIVTQLEQQVE